MGEQVGHAAGAAIFDIVMHRVGIAAGGLKRREYRRCHGAAGNDEALAEHKILEPALLRHHAMLGGIELGHSGFLLSFFQAADAYRYRRGVAAATRSRHSGARRSLEPGISRFRVWSFGPSRNDGGGNVRNLISGP